MNKMNKKGFTLIEMLVVIAIIAVLVAIIVPVVGNSTVKAAAATNAANLRSYASEVAVMYLNPGTGVDVNVDDSTGEISFEDEDGNDVTPAAPTSKACGDFVDNTATATAYLNEDQQIVASFGDDADDLNIEYFAYIAENGTDEGFGE